MLDPNGQWVWPPGDAVEVVPSSTTSYSIGAGSLSAGNRLVVVGVATALPIPNADPTSGIVIVGFNYVPIMVSNGPTTTLTSIAISPSKLTLSKGKSLQLTATGTFSDSSTQDLTTQVAWASSAPAIATISMSGLATGVEFGSATLSATLGSVSSSASLTVFQPTPSPTPPLSQSVTYQIDYAHSGRAAFSTPVAFPPSTTWTVTLPGAISDPLIADGKVFVTTTTSAPNNLYGTNLYAILWSFAGDGALVSAPIVINQFVIVGSNSGNVYALDATTGTPAWFGSAGAAISAPDAQNVVQPLTGLGAGEGYLVVPAGNVLTGWRLSGP